MRKGAGRTITQPRIAMVVVHHIRLGQGYTWGLRYLRVLIGDAFCDESL